MFEGKPPIRPAPKGARTEESTEDSRGVDLSAMTWPDLVAKLDAARDLRAELDETGQLGDASFDAFCAHQLAQQHDRFGKEDERPVNPDNLANGKPRGCKEDARSESDTTANRGHT